MAGSGKAGSRAEAIAAGGALRFTAAVGVMEKFSSKLQPVGRLGLYHERWEISFRFCKEYLVSKTLASALLQPISGRVAPATRQCLRCCSMVAWQLVKVLSSVGMRCRSYRPGSRPGSRPASASRTSSRPGSRSGSLCASPPPAAFFSCPTTPLVAPPVLDERTVPQSFQVKTEIAILTAGFAATHAGITVLGTTASYEQYCVQWS